MSLQIKFNQKILRRYYQLFRKGFYRLLSQNHIEKNVVKIHQPVLSMGEGKIILRNGVNIGFLSSPNFFNGVCYLEARQPNSKIEIGASTHLNNGFSAIADGDTIKIGSNCFIGHNVTMMNSNFHPLDPQQRLLKNTVKSADVIIGDNVFIGANVTILKGATIGSGATIGAGSVVACSIPSNSLAAGNPVQILSTFGNS